MGTLVFGTFDKATNAYATDGKCHNANAGTFNHECGKPAKWLGKTRSGFVSGYCAYCKECGDEARKVVAWQAVA